MRGDAWTWSRAAVKGTVHEGPDPNRPDFLLSHHLPDDVQLPSFESRDQLLIVFDDVTDASADDLGAWLLQVLPGGKVLGGRDAGTGYRDVAQGLIAGGDFHGFLSFPTMLIRPNAVTATLPSLAPNAHSISQQGFTLALIGGALIVLWSGSATKVSARVDSEARGNVYCSDAGVPIDDVASRYIEALFMSHRHAAVALDRALDEWESQFIEESAASNGPVHDSHILGAIRRSTARLQQSVDRTSNQFGEGGRTIWFGRTQGKESYRRCPGGRGSGGGGHRCDSRGR